MGMKRVNIFDFMYYRIARWYFKYEKEDELSKYSFTATLIVSLSQVLILVDIVGVILLENLNQKNRSELISNNIIILILVSSIIAIFNGFYYHKKYEVIHEKWNNKSTTKKDLTDIFITLLIILPLIFGPILLNIKDYSG